MSAPKRKKAYNIDELRSKGLDKQETFLKLTEKWNTETRTGWACVGEGIYTYYKNGADSIDPQLGIVQVAFTHDQKIDIFYSAHDFSFNDPVFPEQVAYVEYDLKNNKQASFWWCPTLNHFLQTKDLWKITKDKEEYKSLTGISSEQDLCFLFKDVKGVHNPYGPASYSDWEFFPKYYFNGRLCKSKAEWQRKIAAKNKKTSTKRDEASILMEQSNKSELRVLEFTFGEQIPKNYTGIAKFSNGTKLWYLNGFLHREDGPAFEWANGTKLWYLDGKQHREDGPACEYSDGYKRWYLNDVRYCSEADWKIALEKLNKERAEASMKKETNNKPELPVLELSIGQDKPSNYTGVVKWPNGSKHWYLNGNLHRVDGPAVEYTDGEKQWWLNGKRHREDGPAYEGAGGYKAWYLNGNHCAEADWKIALEKLKKEREGASVKKETSNKPELQVLELKSGEKLPVGYTGIIKYSDGDKIWYLDGKRHREDGPAIEWSDGTKDWYLNGKLHREDGPACEYTDGSKGWWLNGKSYSEANWKVAVEKLNKERAEASMKKETSNKPELQVLEPKAGELIPDNFTGIIKYSDGTKKWYLNGKYHREDGPAVEWANGDKWWFLNDKRHREDGPAVERADGSREWYLNGLPHRADGPAVEYPSGEKHWFLKGERHREDGPAIEYPGGSKYWYLNGKCYSNESKWKDAVEELKKERAGERKEHTSPAIETSQYSPGTVCQHRMLMDCVSSKPTVMQSIKTTAKKDFNAVVVRVAADKLSDVVQVALIAALKKALDNKTTNQIDKFFSSKQGKVFIKMMVGIIVPMMIQKFPERFQGILEAVSTESRIQAEVHIASTMVDSIGEFITPMLGHFAQSMEALEDSSTGVRVFVEQTNLAATSREESIGETTSIQSRSHLVS